MTNFDKWKEGLTINDVTVTEDGLLVSKDASTKLFNEFRNYTQEIDSDFGCVPAIEDWANATAEDSEPAPLTSTVVWHKYTPHDYPCGDDGQEFLVFGVNGETWIEEWQEDGFVGNDELVTHWAELPEPPKE